MTEDAIRALLAQLQATYFHTALYALLLAVTPRSGWGYAITALWLGIAAFWLKHWYRARRVGR